MADGRIVDSNFDGAPASCVVGDDNIPEGFAQYLIGLKQATIKNLRCRLKVVLTSIKVPISM